MPRDYRRVLEATERADGRGALGRRGGHGGGPWVTPTGFLKYGRELPPPPAGPGAAARLAGGLRALRRGAARHQGARCMDCGIPFCHEGCPLGNLIPEWNDLVYRDDWSEAIERLHATNNFPEFTGRLCPAPCEAACVLGINADPVTIERIEYEIVERAWSTRAGSTAGAPGAGPASGWPSSARARPAWPPPSSWPGPATRWWSSSGPSSPGGLLRYGIPEFKMEKAVLDRRLEQMVAEGIEFRCRRCRPAATGPETPRAGSPGRSARPTSRWSRRQS